MRKLLIINDARPNNTTAGSYIKDKIPVFSGALERCHQLGPLTTRKVLLRSILCDLDAFSAGYQRQEGNQIPMQEVGLVALEIAN